VWAPVCPGMSTTVPGLWRVGATTLRSVVRRLGFWAAILLPVGYVPLLSGVVGGPTESLVVVLLCVHLLCLWAGHGYSPS